MKIAYLASRITLPNAERRRADAIEHDQMMENLKPVFEQAGSNIIDIAWDDEGADWDSFDACIIGTAWDYCDRYDEFLTQLRHINDTTPVFNTPEMVAWNSDKNYLRELESDGLKTIPTHWIDKPNTDINWLDLFSMFETDKLVVKRQIGANAEGQFLLKKGDSAPELTHPVMVQPFLKAIAEEGEHSFIFVDGELSHGLIKRPIQGDYRIQSSYGGTEASVTPKSEDHQTASSVLESLDEMPLYARVDMVRDDSGILSLMELELIEPFLYPLQGSNLGKYIHQALRRRLKI